MGNHTPVEPSAEQISRANDMWGRFTWLMNISVIATIATLILLAAVFFLFVR